MLDPLFPLRLQFDPLILPFFFHFPVSLLLIGFYELLDIDYEGRVSTFLHKFCGRESKTAFGLAIERLLAL